jgi:hypothetical protein
MAPVAAAAEAVTTAPAGTTAEADTPQKLKSEPTCQNGRPHDEAEAQGSATTLTRPSGTLSKGEKDLATLTRPSPGAPGLSQGEWDYRRQKRARCYGRCGRQRDPGPGDGIRYTGRLREG